VGVWTTTTTNNITDSVFVISGTPTVAGTFSYTVTTLGGCVTNTAFVTGIIDVKPLNRIQLTSAAGTISQTLCFGNSIQSITYTTTGALGAVVTGLPNGLVGVWTTTTTNNVTDSVFTISGTPTQAGTFSYTISLIGGCGTITSTGVIDVKINVINLSSSVGTDAQTICINTPLTQIKYKTILATGAVATGLPNGVVGVWTTTTTNNITDSVFTISGTPTQSGTFTYTITLTGGCYTVTTTGTIDVKPDNTISLNSVAGTDSQTVCINAPLTEIKYKTTGATGAVATGLPNGLVGVWTTTTTNNITDSVFVISGTPTVAGTFSYTVTTLGGCITNTAFVTGTIDVKPNNKISLFIGSDGQGVCVNTAIQSLTYTTTGALGAVVTGLPNGVTGVWTTTTNNNIQDSIYFISGTPTESGIFNYTITLTGGCGIIRQNGTLFVKENKIILNSSAGTDNQTNCINSPITNIVYRTEVATSATVFGLPNGVTAVWVDSVLTISGISTQSGTFTYTINTVGGCSSKTATGVITIKPNNTITQVSAPETNNQTLCINASINDIRYQSTGATGVEVIGLPAGITGVWEDSLITIKGSPTQAGTFAYTVNLTGGCGVVSSTGMIEVKINAINLLTDSETEKQVVCINTSINQIKYKTSIATGAYVTGLPKGVYGNWSIVANQGVVDSIFVINGTPIESGTYTYTITLTGGCSNVERVGVLNISPESNPGNIGFEKGASPICSLGTTPTISLFNYVGETINWEKASSKDSIYRDMGEVGYQLINNINNVSEELSSVITLYRAKIKSGACPAKYSPSISIEVLPLPKVISSIPDTICGPGVLALSAKSNLGTINWYSGPSSEQILYTGDNFISPVVDSSSTFYASGIYNGCSSIQRIPVTSVVKYVPQIIKIVNNEICGPGKLNLIAKASKGVVNWYEKNIGGVKLITDTLFSTPKIDSTKIYYAEAQYEGCVSQQRVSVYAVINQLPIVKALPSPSFTCVGKGIYVDKYVSGGTPGYEFIIKADNKNVLGTNYGKISGKFGGTSQVSYQVKDQKGCLSQLSNEFTVIVDTPISPKVFFYEAYYDENLIIKTKTDSTYTKYLWEPQLKLNYYNDKNPTFRGVTDQTYYLLRTDTLTQCDVTDTYNVTVTRDHILLLPNAFTPNGDGLNDVIKIINNAGIGEFRYLKIFNRFGKIVFQTNNMSEGWNGKVGDQLQQMDAYYYTAEYVTKENLVVIKNGSFILLN
jgi:gliding motility-associated-like protein